MSSANPTARIAIRSLRRGAAAKKTQKQTTRSAGRGESVMARPTQKQTTRSAGRGESVMARLTHGAQSQSDHGRRGTNRLYQLSRSARDASPPRSVGAGRGEPRSAAPRSTLAQSVLDGRGRQGRHGSAPYSNARNERTQGPRRREGARRIEDWYSSSARKEALESMKDLSRSLVETQTQTQRPFAWADFERVVEQLPDQHWAEPFVQGVIRNLEANPAVEGREKERILGSILQTLSDLSTENERFQDAEV